MIVYGSGALARSRVFDNGAWPASVFAACVAVLATPIAVAAGANGWTVYCLEALLEIAIAVRITVIVYHENTYMLKPEAKEEALKLGSVLGLMVVFLRGLMSMVFLSNENIDEVPFVVGASTFLAGLMLPSFLLLVAISNLVDLDVRKKYGLMSVVTVSGTILRAVAVSLYYLPISSLSPAVMPALLVVGTVLVAQTLMMHPSFKIVT